MRRLHDVCADSIRSRKSYDAVPDDDVRLHLEFVDVMCVTLEAAKALITCQQVPAKHVNNVLMRKASEQRLSPTTYIWIWPYSHQHGSPGCGRY